MVTQTWSGQSDRKKGQKQITLILDEEPRCRLKRNNSGNPIPTFNHWRFQTQLGRRSTVISLNAHVHKTIYTGRSSVSLHPGRLKWLSWLDWTNVTQSGGAEQEIMLMVLTVSQLCGGKRCLRDKESVDSPCQMTCRLSFCFLWDCFLPQHSFLFCCVWPGVFPACVKEGAEMCALSCWGCYNMRYGQRSAAWMEHM